MVRTIIFPVLLCTLSTAAPSSALRISRANPLELEGPVSVSAQLGTTPEGPEQRPAGAALIEVFDFAQEYANKFGPPAVIPENVIGEDGDPFKGPRNEWREEQEAREEQLRQLRQQRNRRLSQPQGDSRAKVRAMRKIARGQPAVSRDADSIRPVEDRGPSPQQVYDLDFQKAERAAGDIAITAGRFPSEGFGTVKEKYWFGRNNPAFQFVSGGRSETE